jgi:two-component system chemotaxis sensor kinase CheA
MAIPLSVVARLEEFPRRMLENLGARQVVQYRGEILPLVDVSVELKQLQRDALQSVAERPAFVRNVAADGKLDSSADTIPVVVCDDASQRVGLMVGKILDIVHDPISARSRANRPGVLFTAVVQEKVTEFIDVAALIREATANLPPPRA